MTSIPLRLGTLGAYGFAVQRSGIRWLCDEGHDCRPGEVIAYCNIGLVPSGRSIRAWDPFVDEQRDFQVAFAPRIAGRLRKAADSSRGGFLDLQQFYQHWSHDYIIGHLEAPTGDRVADDGTDSLRLLFVAGRRTTELAEVRSGLLTGWHDRSRAWWGDGDDAPGTVLSMGICELAGVIRGERSAFLELFAAVPGPAHAIYNADDALVPCARVALEQMHRTTAEFDAIAADFAKTFASGSVIPSPGDWMFGAALLSALRHSPLTATHDTLTRTGLRRNLPVDAVILSLHAEPTVVLRHRRLGYAVNCHGFRIAQAGPGVREWLHTQFEPVSRTPDDIRCDLRELIDTVRARGDMRVLILNSMSTSGFEDVYTYAPFDRPMRDTLSSVRSKEMNLMLHDLARERDVSIVDVDTIAAELGAAAHLPDGVHASGPLQAEVREEILRLLAGHRVPGFFRAPVR
ncbi:MAG: hypothetical protein ABI724_08015 [Betaproteobacteria bacterium]